MSNKRIILFLAVAASALAVFAFVGLPYMQLDFASAQYYGGGGGSGGPENDGEPAVDLNDPNVGDARRAPVAAPDGLRFGLTPACDLLDAPGGNVVIPGSANGGGEFPINGFSADGTYTRITVGPKSAWVLSSCGFSQAAAANLPFLNE